MYFIKGHRTGASIKGININGHRTGESLNGFLRIMIICDFFTRHSEAPPREGHSPLPAILVEEVNMIF